jgi:hypothetical protein
MSQVVAGGAQNREMQVSELVVEADPDAVARTRAVVLRAKRSSAWSGAIGGALLVGLAVAITAAVGLSMAWPLLAVGVAGVVLVADSRRHFVAVRRMSATWAAIGVPPEAMRFSQEGLRCRIDVAPRPCFLPWPSVAAFHLRGGRILAVQLAPGVAAATPGVSGLDQHEVRRALRRRELRFPVSSLRRPPEDIDKVLAAFTAGRLRIR